MYRSTLIPLLSSLLLHAGLLAVLLVDWPGSSESRVRAPEPAVVQARVLSMDEIPPTRAQVEAARQQALQEQRQREAQQRQRQEQQRREQERQRQEQQRREQERQRQEQQRQEQQRQEQQRQEQQRREQERRQREEAERREAERQRVLAEQARQDLAAAMAAEEAALQEASDARLVGSYSAAIRRAIQNNWVRPPSARNDMEVHLLIQLVPTGEVVQVSVIRSSGDAAFDQSAEAAVRRVGRFPELQELPGRVFEQNFRRFRLEFRPEDLRR